ncbi:MAG: hypothetical protein IK134_14395 [Oscillospiraceae bacterium]|nr:hypothetical protein [Oscillospiraceae bacterium]
MPAGSTAGDAFRQNAAESSRMRRWQPMKSTQMRNKRTIFHELDFSTGSASVRDSSLLHLCLMRDKMET